MFLSCYYFFLSSEIYMERFWYSWWFAKLRNFTDNGVLVGLSSTDFFSVFKARWQSLLAVLSKSFGKLPQLISVGLGTNDWSFLSKDFSAGDKTSLLSTILFWTCCFDFFNNSPFFFFSRFIILRLLLHICFDLLNLLSPFMLMVGNSNVIYLVFCVSP